MSSARNRGVSAIKNLGVQSESCWRGMTREGEVTCNGVLCSPIASSAAQREGCWTSDYGDCGGGGGLALVSVQSPSGP